MAAPATARTASPQHEYEPPADEADRHEQEVEDKEAHEYWGYLFRSDKTGTDKLKSLLRGLKNAMNTQFDSQPEGAVAKVDAQPDLTPDQLAHFYRELHGNYDQLFLGTPNDSLAFIYKSLGCLHSLQPQSFTHSTAFNDPTVPALKTEGWIMWQTIQILLGPEEHSHFIMEAVQKWDVNDPVTGELFPKLLPRSCFPSEPDKHMVAWYEGVSERLKKEAEDEERLKDIEAERAEVRRLRQRAAPVDDPAQLTDEEGSVDSRGPALAYFRNPLYRHVDGRPSIVRRGSKRPALSPRPTMMGRGKEAANTMGHVIRNIGSPNLWSGPHGRGGSRHASRESSSRRRRSVPDNRHAAHHPEAPVPPTAAGAYDGVGLSPNEQRHRRRRSSQQPVSPNSGDDDDWDADESSAAYFSPRPTPPHHPGHHHHRRGPSDAHRPDSRDSAAGLRHSRSHEPTPSQKEYGDYFEGYDDPGQRRNSAYDASQASNTPPAGNAGGGGSGGGGFGPSASPLFATHVAKRPQPPAPQYPGPPRQAADPAVYPQMLRPNPSVRRAQEQSGRPYSRSPADPNRRPDRYDSPRRARFEQSPGRFGHDDGPPLQQTLSGEGRRPPSRSFDLPHNTAYPPPPPGSTGPGAGPRRPPSGRYSGDDHGPSSGSGGGGGPGRYATPDDGRQGRPKMTRFAGEGGPPGPEDGERRRPVSRGVHGRRYVSEAPWSRE